MICRICLLAVWLLRNPSTPVVQRGVMPADAGALLHPGLFHCVIGRVKPLISHVDWTSGRIWWLAEVARSLLWLEQQSTPVQAAAVKLDTAGTTRTLTAIVQLSISPYNQLKFLILLEPLSCTVSTST